MEQTQTVYEIIKDFCDGMLGADFAATSKYIAGGMAVALTIGLLWLVIKVFKTVIRW